MNVCKLDHVWSLLVLAALAGCRSAPWTKGNQLDLLAQLDWSTAAKSPPGITGPHRTSTTATWFSCEETAGSSSAWSISRSCARTFADSRFSHVGLVSREQDGVFVYDVVVGGPRHVPFGKFATDQRISLIRRKTSEAGVPELHPAAVEYCRKSAEQRQVRYGIETGQRALLLLGTGRTGLSSCGAAVVPAGPHRSAAPFRRVAGDHENDPPYDDQYRMDQEIFLPGNEQIGIWACPYLDSGPGRHANRSAAGGGSAHYHARPTVVRAQVAKEVPQRLVGHVQLGLSHRPCPK